MGIESNRKSLEEHAQRMGPEALKAWGVGMDKVDADISSHDRVMKDIKEARAKEHWLKQETKRGAENA